MVLGWKKKSDKDVIDFVELQKRGLISAARSQSAESGIPIGDDGIVDFTSSASTESSSSGYGSASTESSASSGGGFLDFMTTTSAGSRSPATSDTTSAGSSSPATSSTGDTTTESGATDFWGNPLPAENTPSTTSTTSLGSRSPGLSGASYEGDDHLKTKVEDLEYKMERLLERLEELESKNP